VPAAGPASVVIVPETQGRRQLPTGTEHTAYAMAAPAIAAPERTAAASPVAIQTTATAPTPAPLSPDPTTRPAMMVLGAAGIGAPLSASASAETVLAVPAAAVIAAIDPAIAAAPPGDRTLRSAQGPEADGVPVKPHGVAVATGAVAIAPPSVVAPGPRTQVAGAVPLPGASVPVVAAPRRTRTIPGTKISVWPLVAVGALFAAIGVAITLWIMLRAPAPVPDSTLSPSGTADPNDADLQGRTPRSGLRGPTAPQPQPGKVHGKGHGK
jgi:hypothetical protein